MRLGDWTLDWLHDTAFGLDGGAMFGVVPRIVWQRKYPADRDHFIPLALRPLLIRGYGRTILVDSGYGSKLDARQQWQFRLIRPCDPVRALAAANLAPEDITDVIVTHMHPDHAGGLVTRDPDGRLVPTFPRARIHLQELELEALHTLHPRTRHAYPEENWRPLEESGCLVPVHGHSELAPGLELHHTGGHSLGHQALTLSGGGQTVLHLGDLMATHAHLNPLWVMAFDDFPMDSILAKQTWLERARQEGWWIAFYHDLFHLAGRLSPEGPWTELLRAPRTPDVDEALAKVDDPLPSGLAW
ncbi:MAG: MBL fold metallo-hydrolase [Candidatus Sericytochromatia bacterium]|nr:MBL fold metallo-hydrolase [Candidatus Sericytochromatia bacterium]